jgi:hypothetical protein
MDIIHELAFELLLDEDDWLKDAIPQAMSWVAYQKHCDKWSLTEVLIATKRISL